MFFEDIWYCVARAPELSSQPVERVVCNQPIVLFQTARSGAPAALANRSPYRTWTFRCTTAVDGPVDRR